MPASVYFWNTGRLRILPLLVRWYIKTGLVHLAIALLLAVLLAAQPVLDLPSWLAALRPVFLHLLIVGWITQFIFGIAYWMFTKQSKECPRGNTRLGWLVFVLLNLGLVLRAVAEPLVVIEPDAIAGASLALSAVLLVGCPLPITWTRVRER